MHGSFGPPKFSTLTILYVVYTLRCVYLAIRKQLMLHWFAHSKSCTCPIPRFSKVGIEDCAGTYGEKRLPLLFNGIQRSAVGASEPRRVACCAFLDFRQERN